MSGQWNGRVGKFLALFAPSAYRGCKYSPHGNAEERIRGVGPVVHILLKLTAFTGWTAASNQGHGVDFDQQCCRAAFCRSFGVEHISRAEGQFLPFAGGLDSCAEDKPRSVAGRWVVEIVRSITISLVELLLWRLR